MASGNLRNTLVLGTVGTACKKFSFYQNMVTQSMHDLVSNPNLSKVESYKHISLLTNVLMQI